MVINVPVVGQIAGAAAGAIVVGSSSGKAGYDKESICVDVPLKF